MKSSKLCLTALMAAISLGIYALECLIPPVIPVPGVKIGLANVVTLVCLYTLNAKCAFSVLMIRIVVSSLLFAQPVSMIFSLSGGLLSFGIMLVLKRFFDTSDIWAISVFGAFGHNFGQILAAVLVTGELSVAYYFLFLIISSVITGAFTGICAQSAIKKIKKIKF